jgi:demethylmenaquinone methyltransferase/2-methoxy-6-polyprenyl-1,4-benzoquinol methylase
MVAIGEGAAHAETTARADRSVSFADIARWYDGLNRLMSLGRDRRWRQLVAQALDLPANGRALDVGAGTGDMTLALLHHRPGSTVVSLDPTVEMMQLAQHKRDADRAQWTHGDGLSLPFSDGCFDGVVSAFVLRNVTDVGRALAEQARVVRPGGRVVCLEMTWPRTPGIRTLFKLYFSDLMPRITGTLSGQHAAYRFLPWSVQHFVAPDELVAKMERAGLHNVRYRMLALGTVALHVGERTH